MKCLPLVAAILFSATLAAQQADRRIIIITTDGFRWQEVFGGMDSAIANDHRFNEGDSGYIYKTYWAATAEERRAKLMPFIWNRLVPAGQIYGNRRAGNRVDNANPYWFSYPGYSEIMTGFADTAINSNGYPDNPHVNVLEFLNRQPGLKGRVAAFGAWNAFDRILNEKRSGIPVVCAMDNAGGVNPTAAEKLINKMRTESYKPFLEDECLDVFTHQAAMEWLKNKKPAVLYIAYGETDEWAHSGKYRAYLDAARQVDNWIREIWDFVQADPYYRNKTTLFITTDHGRGDIKKENWTSHGSDIPDAHEIWFAVTGPGIPVTGEVKKFMQLYQEQFAQTIARLTGYRFTADHPIAPEINPVIEKIK